MIKLAFTFVFPKITTEVRQRMGVAHQSGESSLHVNDIVEEISTHKQILLAHATFLYGSSTQSP